MLKNDEKFAEIYQDACMGDSNAIDFLKRLADIYRVWDDIWDGNREHDREAIDACFADAMFGLSTNSFYSAYRHVLEPQIFLAYNAWHDANIWAERDDEKFKIASFFVKNQCDEIIMLCAFLIGGVEHARKISLNVREYVINGG